MWESIKDFSEVISLLNSQIDKGQNISLVRRLLVRAYIKRMINIKMKIRPIQDFFP